MICFVCHSDFVTSNLLIRHLKLAHGLCSGRSLRLKCGQSGCILEFASFSGYRKHLNRVHTVKESPNDLQAVFPASNQYFGCDYRLEFAPSSDSVSCKVPITNQSLVDLSGSALAQLQTAGVGQSIVNQHAMTLEELVHEIQAQVMDTAFESLSLEKTETISKLKKSFEKIANPFTALNSVSKRDVHFRNKWTIVDPVEVVLGTRFENRKSKITGMYDQIVVTDKFSYIPILQTLRSIFNNVNVPSALKSNHAFKDGIYADLIDGIHMKSHTLFSSEKQAIQIQLFFDEFETANALGSKKGLYKLGGLYFTIRNFPPKFNSSLTNIHLCALFHSQDIKTYGFDAILRPLVNDLKVLETQGIEVKDVAGHVRGSIVQVVGDNLGLNSILGFVESFSSTYCCRLCLLPKYAFQTVFYLCGISVRSSAFGKL